MSASSQVLAINKPTLYALASGRGAAGVAVVRVSGPQAFRTAQRIAGALPALRTAGLRLLRVPASGELLDQALVLCFQAPHSFTGEDVVEFHVHGSPAVVAGLLDVLAAEPGLRLAEPGGFTRQAFDNDKLDLTQVEGLADLVAAETRTQRQQALQQMRGGLAQCLEGWRAQLMPILAYTEAEIDFGEEEESVGLGISLALRPKLQALGQAMRVQLALAHQAERVRSGLSVAIIGAPNSGKSTLINALAKRDVAIVSTIPGTTRDVLEVHLDLGGFAVTLLDTAGLRESTDPIEQEGIRRARARAEAADLVLHLIAAEEYSQQMQGLQAGVPNRQLVLSKYDLCQDKSALAATARHYAALCTSSAEPESFSRLLAYLTNWAQAQGQGLEAAFITRARHKVGVADCLGHIEAALAQGDMVLTAEELRLALRALGRLTGRVDVEALLDIIFRDFCIGK
jgi:tRNA modification GTPase